MQVWAAASLVLAAVWIGGLWRGIVWHHVNRVSGEYRSAALGCGVLYLARTTYPNSLPPPPGLWFIPLRAGDGASSWRWLPRFHWGGWMAWEVFVPLWMPLALSVAATVRSRRLEQRLAGGCPICRYDLAGNTTGVCPECGAPAAVPPVP